MTKGGERRYYGLREESRVTLPTTGGDPAGSIAVWALDRVEDAWGNYYDVHYNDGFEDFGLRGLIATSITYTGHHDSPSSDCGNTPTNICPPNIIRFSYEARPDHRQTRFHNSPLMMSQRLTGISTGLGTYGIQYYQPGDSPDEALLPSRINTISYSAAPTPTSPFPEPLASLSFGWDKGGYGWDLARAPIALGPDNTVTQEDSYDLPITINFQGLGGSADPQPNGVQFVDLDGDGRVDLIESRDASDDTLYDASAKAWWNTGHGWHRRDDWHLPISLIGKDHKPKAVLADVDGDGLPDLVGKGNDGKPVVYFNMIKQNEGWVSDNGMSAQTFPVSWQALHLDRQNDGTIDTVIDMDGDGMADIVRQSPNVNIDVLLGSSLGWSPSPISYYTPTNGDYSYNYTLQDVNRDGLPDLMGRAGGSLGSAYINLGAPRPGVGIWAYSLFPEPLPSYDARAIHMADVDGDGFDDIIEQYASGNAIHNALAFGNGAGYTTTLNDSYLASMAQYQYRDARTSVTWPVPVSQVGDINGDGLVDLIELMPCALVAVCDPTGQLLINTSTGWTDPGGATENTDVGSAYTLPFMPATRGDANGAALIDVNGDGLVDIARAQTFLRWNPKTKPTTRLRTCGNRG